MDNSPSSQSQTTSSQSQTNSLPVRENKGSTFDDVLLVLGEFGLYQKVILFLCSLPFVFTSMQLIGWVFVGSSVPFRCNISNPYEDVSHIWNDSEINSCSYTLPNGSINECQEGFIYNTSIIGDSVTIEFDLVCENKMHHATIGASPMFGYLIGGMIFGHLADKFGRKPTFILANAFLLLGGIGGAAAPEFFTFVTSRVIVGFAIAGIEVACFVMGMELVGKSKRTFAGIFCWFFETSGYLLALVLAILVNSNWRLLQLLYSAPCVIFFGYYWLAPESARWLISQGKTSEAIKIIEKTAKINKVHLSQEFLLGISVEEEAITDEKFSVLDLFRFPILRAKTFILLFAWVVCSALYYVLLLDQTELSDNLYIGFLMTTVIQLPGYFYVLLTLERPTFGRKRSMCGFLIISGICLFLHPLVYLLPGQTGSSSWLRVVLSIIGRFSANCSYTILNLYSAELFPTVVRSLGVGFTLVVSRLGTILGPYLLLAGHFAPMVLGVGALTAGLLSLMLPETLGKKLPETLEDGENLTLTLPSCLKRKEKNFDNF